VTPRDDLRDRIAKAIVSASGDDVHGWIHWLDEADAILAAIPGLVDASDAREGWLDDSDPAAWEVLDHDHGAYALTRVLVIDATKVAS
jgi:hypothetical protein